MITFRFDLDDVLNRFSEFFLDYHYKKTGEQLVWESWNLHLHSRYGMNIWNHLEDPDFFTKIPMELNADRLISYMDSQASIFDYKIVSSYYGDKKKVFKDVFMQKKSWVYKKLGERAMKRFILVKGSKENFPADVIVDDYYQNLIGTEIQKSLKFFYKRRHNHNINLNTNYLVEISSIKELLSYIEDIPFYNNIDSYLKSEFEQ